MRKFEIKPGLEKKLVRLNKKDRPTYEKVMKKIEDIVSVDNVDHYKNLRYDMKECKRVHLGHFVLVFSYDKKRHFVSFEDFENHDRVYS